MTGQLIGQEVVHSLVAFIVLVDVANEYFHHDTAVLQHTHIFLEVSGSGEETAWSKINWSIELNVTGEVIPVRIKNESHFLDSADSDYLDKILRQRPFCPRFWMPLTAMEGIPCLHAFSAFFSPSWM